MTTAQSKVLPTSFSIDGIATIAWYCNRPKFLSVKLVIYYAYSWSIFLYIFSIYFDVGEHC